MKIKNEQFFITLRNYLLVYLPKNCESSPNTIKSYTDSLNVFFNYLEKAQRIPLAKVGWEQFTHTIVADFLAWLRADRKCQQSTCRQRLTAIRSFVQYASIMDICILPIQAALEKIVIPKSPKKLIEYMSKDALTEFLRQPDLTKFTGLRNMVFLAVMYDTAARCQEMVDIRLCDLILTGKSPQVYLRGKGQKTRATPLLPKTTEHIKYYMEKYHPETSRNHTDRLFYTVIHGERHRMSEDTVAVFVRKYGISAHKECSNVPERVHPHMIRHTRAMHWYQDGVPLTIIADLLGHSLLQTTKIYASADTNMKRDAIRKANSTVPCDISDAIWNNDEEMIRKLTGLK